MQTMTERKLQSFLETVQGEMHVERTAILHNVKNLKAITPIIKSFDGKVINKKFNDALMEAVGYDVYCENLPNSKNLIARFRGTVKVGERNRYAQGYERVVINMTMSQLNNKRLSADETIESVNQFIDRLEKQAELFIYDEGKATARFEKLMAIEASIEALMEESDSLTMEALRRLSYKIR